jgi:hypothetical protein
VEASMSEENVSPEEGFNRLHKHDPKHCDIIICWEHDWQDCPNEVICLKERVREFK